MLIEDAVSSGTPQFVIDSYATLAERAKTNRLVSSRKMLSSSIPRPRSFGAGQRAYRDIGGPPFGREVVDRFDTFVHPKQLIPAEITELTSITNADVVDAPSAVDAVAALADFVGGCPVIAHNATFDRSFIESVKAVSTSAISGLIRWHCRASHFRAWPRTSCLLWPTCLAATRCRTAPTPMSTPCVAYGACCSWRSPTCPRANGALGRHAPRRTWSYRPIFSFLAGQNPGSIFSLSAAADVLKADRADDRVMRRAAGPQDAEPRGNRGGLCPGGLVNRMYPTYEPRDEQIAMALEVRDALCYGNASRD
ncbi:MAG: PolC-type DNA polymerase III [Collinsella sp.]